MTLNDSPEVCSFSLSLAVLPSAHALFACLQALMDCVSTVLVECDSKQRDTGRLCEFRRQNMFECEDALSADIVIAEARLRVVLLVALCSRCMQVKITPEMNAAFCTFLSRMKVSRVANFGAHFSLLSQVGARLLTYENIEALYRLCHMVVLHSLSW